MISILITIKDRQSYLDRQVIFLTDQLSKIDVKWEIIFYDDGSQHPLTLPSLCDQVRLVRGEANVGLIEARNRLAKLASMSSDYILFLDDDIFIHNIEVFITTAIEDIRSGYSCVSAPYINLPTYKYERISTFKHIYDVRRCDDDVVYFFGGTTIFDRDAFFKAGGLEGNYYIYLEEEDLALRMFSRSMKMKIMYGENVLAIHDQAPGKNFSERQVFLLSNRFIYHYKFIHNSALRLLFNVFYVLVYCLKFRSLNLIKSSVRRYSEVKSQVVREKIGSRTVLRFLVKRYFNV